jgi:hypothetical protein
LLPDILGLGSNVRVGSLHKDIWELPRLGDKYYYSSEKGQRRHFILCLWLAELVWSLCHVLQKFTFMVCTSCMFHVGKEKCNTNVPVSYSFCDNSPKHLLKSLKKVSETIIQHPLCCKLDLAYPQMHLLRLNVRLIRSQTSLEISEESFRNHNSTPTLLQTRFSLSSNALAEVKCSYWSGPKHLFKSLKKVSESIIQHPLFCKLDWAYPQMYLPGLNVHIDQVPKLVILFLD